MKMFALALVAGIAVASPLDGRRVVESVVHQDPRVAARQALLQQWTAPPSALGKKHPACFKAAVALLKSSVLNETIVEVWGKSLGDAGDYYWCVGLSDYDVPSVGAMVRSERCRCRCCCCVASAGC